MMTTTPAGLAGTTHETEGSVGAPCELATLNVIVCDDDAMVVSLVRELLLDLHVGQVRVATDGSSLLDQLDAEGADVLILDVNMPGMDGVEVLRHLVERDARPALIMMSAESERTLKTAHALAAAHRLDVLGPLGKPVRRARLEECLEQVIELRAAMPSGSPGPVAELSPQEIADGLREGALVPWFQPKVDTVTRAVRGVEALARWQSNGQTLPPSAFIEVAERSGLIRDLTRVMVEATLGAVAPWHRAGWDLQVAINVSVTDLEEADFHDFMVAAAQRAGVPPAMVTLEITESRLVAHVTRVLETLTRLRLRRFRLSLDDYGTGASTLEQVRRMPIDELKIDRAFVNGASADPSLAAMLRSTARLAQHLELETVAEGVETESDWALVREVGVDLVQGYAAARPMPGDEFAGWREAWP